MTNKIIFDIVFTWVDFNNEIWKQDYNNYYNNLNKKNNYNIMNRSNSNLEELKYSLRSIKKYLKVPINKIYIITNYGSKPNFLKESDKIIVISYMDLLGKISFNSQAIESVLHTIPNLNEYYIYFNDDFILNNFIYKNDLIDNSGNIIWYSESNFFINLNSKINIDIFNFDSGVDNSRKYTYKKIFKNNNIDITYVKPIGHCLRVFKKDLVIEFVNLYIKYINKLRNTIFRTDKMFCFIDGFCLHYILNNKVEFKDTKKTLILVQNDENNFVDSIINLKNEYSMYFNNSYDFICVEDIRQKNINENSNIKVFLENQFNIKLKYEN